MACWRRVLHMVTADGFVLASQRLMLCLMAWLLLEVDPTSQGWVENLATVVQTGCCHGGCCLSNSGSNFDGATPTWHVAGHWIPDMIHRPALLLVAATATDAATRGVALRATWHRRRTFGTGAGTGGCEQLQHEAPGGPGARPAGCRPGTAVESVQLPNFQQPCHAGSV